ncbi:penicillin-binding transpeptidase domain-containing protein [Alicyclobacillus fodiniaquatilis]|uniref:Penicillin-binding transpeptidase domain-containing protein n=1 Tax=Alicyclobacillus fodiniaquatilis TaxID=1661150 RepID=A0ABW4JNC0_9BACL
MSKYNSGWQRKKATQPRKQSKRSKKRLWVVQGGLILVLSTILWRVYDVQKVYGDQLEKNEKLAVDADNTLLAPRGAILDAQGNELAYDVPASYVDIKTADLKKYAAQIAAEIAPILGTSTSKVVNLLQEDSPWVRYPKPILATAQTKLQAAFDAHKWAPANKSVQWSADVTFSPTEQRLYPYDDFAANTIGFVEPDQKNQSDIVGVGGIEEKFNKQLSGTNGTVDFQRDAYGYPLPGSVHVTKKAQPGDNIQLTLDETIQGYVESEMAQLVKQYKPQHAAIIVTNPQTGAILAMSSAPSFNPNSYASASPDALYTNWAVNSSFEPGSTFKPFVLAAALATNSVSLYDTYMSGHTTVDGQTISDWDPAGWGVLTFQQALEESSNVGFAKIAEKLGWPNLDHYMNLFGFDKPTGVDLPDEASSILFKKSQQGELELATSGFGQGISVTPLQQVAAMGVIANGGKLMRPYVVSKITSPDGKVIKQVKPTVVRQNFIPQNVLNEVKNTMVLDVSDPKYGLDSSAKIAGYEVAGKTGTAQVANPKTGQYYSDRFITSFMGFAPAQDPQVEVYVTVDWPKTPEADTWGSSIAAPYAKAIMKETLDYDHIAPTGDVPSASADTPKGNQVQYVQTPNIVGLSQQAAKAKLSSMGLDSMFVGTSGTVEKQWPPVGVEVTKGSKMYGLLQHAEGSKVSVPNLTGLSLRDATNLLAALSLNISPTGNGFVTKQAVAAGTSVASGTAIPVTLSPQ